MLEPQYITFIVVICLLILIVAYYYASYEYVTVTPCTKEENCKREDKNCDKHGQGDFKIAFLANRGTNYLEARIINVIIAKSQYYVYSDKKAYHVQQLEKDNRVSLLIYTKQGESMKQVLLYGELEPVNETCNLNLYKLNIDSRKIAITVETEETRSTSYTFNGGDQKNLVTDFSELNALIAHLST